MIASAKLDQLAAALSNAQGEFESVSKSGENPHFRSKFAPLNEIVKSATPILAKHDLSVMQFPGHEAGVDTLITIVLHKSGQHIGSAMLLKLPKNDAQGQGSAMTYARRYSYMAALGLVADVDDDGNAASQAPSRPAAAPPAPDLTPMQQAARQDLKDAYSRASAAWSSMADSEKNEVAERAGFALPLQAEFNRRARMALNDDVEAGTVDEMVEFTAQLEKLVPR